MNNSLCTIQPWKHPRVLHLATKTAKRWKHQRDYTRSRLNKRDKVIIVDGMALVNAMPITERIKTCNDFAQVFLDQLSNMAGDYDEVRLVSTPLSKNKFEENGQRGNHHNTMARTLPQSRIFLRRISSRISGQRQN